MKEGDVIISKEDMEEMQRLINEQKEALDKYKQLRIDTEKQIKEAQEESKRARAEFEKNNGIVRSATYKKAVYELELLDQLKERPLILDFKRPMLNLIDSFGNKKNASVTHAKVLTDVIFKLLTQEPLLEVTGEDDEWFELKGFYQSKRSNQLRKEKKDSDAYYQDAIFFINEKGDSFRGVVNGVSSSQKVTFPFIPKTFYVEIKRDLLDPNKEYKTELDHYSIKDEGQLETIFNYYKR